MYQSGRLGGGGLGLVGMGIMPKYSTNYTVEMDPFSYLTDLQIRVSDKVKRVEAQQWSFKFRAEMIL